MRDDSRGMAISCLLGLHRMEPTGLDLAGATLSWAGTVERCYDRVTQCSRCGKVHRKGLYMLPLEWSQTARDGSGWPVNEHGDRLPIAA